MQNFNPVKFAFFAFGQHIFSFLNINQNNTNRCKIVLVRITSFACFFSEYTFEIGCPSWILMEPFKNLNILSIETLNPYSLV